MPLSPAEQTQIQAIITREGGVQNFASEVQALLVSASKSSALSTLSPAISVTVSNWAALVAYVASVPDNSTMFSVMADITAAAQAQDASKLGPLFVALYAAVKKHLGL